MAENDVSQWIPSVTDDYMAGKVTFTAGSKDITFKDAFNGAEKSYTAGDSIYIPTEGRWLLLKEITSTTKGSLLYPCPESCAGTFDLLIRPLARNARQAGLATMTLRNLNVGNLPGLANAKLKTGQILVASQIAGSFDAIDLNADNVAETDARKFMTANERLKLAKLKTDLTAADIAETDKAKIMTADERNKIAKLDENYLAKSGGTISGALTVTGGIDANVLTVQGKARLCEGGNITGPDWSYGDLNKHIESRCAAYADDRKNACVTGTRLVGWSEAVYARDKWSGLPTGYFVNSCYIDGAGNYRIGGNQIQLYIANRGWFPLGA